MAIEPQIYARYAQMHVPRYTSYPTAPHFSAAIGALEYAQWLQALPTREALSLYIHVPFCREMCWYCGCHTSIARREAPVRRYVSALRAEIRLVASLIGSRATIGHLHWGGGTPTMLPPDCIAALSHELAEAFAVAEGAEIAIEVDPRTLTEAAVAQFARAGVNRASLGVQSFDSRVQEAINRVQSFETTAEAARLLRAHGVSAINLDLVYGLPFQTIGSCLETARQALLLCPDRLAIFGYAHVPDFKPHQRKIDGTALPGPPEREEQFRAIAGLLVAQGYVQIGLDHFALPSDPLARAAASEALRRNFQGYTVDKSRTLLGLGASAIGRLPGGYVQNAPRLPDYERRIAAGTLAAVRGCALSDEDRRRAAIIEGLMCDYKADIGAVAAPLGQLEADGLVRRSGNLVELTEDARPLVRVVAAAFDAYLPGSGARHSLAV